jgi:hypothetical protein
MLKLKCINNELVQGQKNSTFNSVDLRLQDEAGAFALGLVPKKYRDAVFVRRLLVPQCAQQAQSAWGKKIETPCCNGRIRSIHHVFLVCPF